MDLFADKMGPDRKIVHGIPTDSSCDDRIAIN